MTLVPAYGRDYKNAKEVKADFDADKDFLINDVSSRDNGRYVNRADLKDTAVKEVKIRYAKLTEFIIIPL